MKKIKFLVLAFVFVLGLSSCNDSDDKETVVYRARENTREYDGLKGAVKTVNTTVYKVDWNALENTAVKRSAESKGTTYYSPGGLKSGEVIYEAFSTISGAVDFRKKIETQYGWDAKHRETLRTKDSIIYIGTSEHKYFRKDSLSYDDANKQAVYTCYETLTEKDKEGTNQYFQEKGIYALNSFGLIDKDNYTLLQRDGISQFNRNVVRSSEEGENIMEEMKTKDVQRVILKEELQGNSNWLEGYLKETTYNADKTIKNITVSDYQIRSFEYWK